MAVGETAMSLEREILPELANQEELFGLVSSDPFVQVLYKRILNIYLTPRLSEETQESNLV